MIKNVLGAFALTFIFVSQCSADLAEASAAYANSLEYATVTQQTYEYDCSLFEGFETLITNYVEGGGSLTYDQMATMLQLDNDYQNYQSCYESCKIEADMYIQYGFMLMQQADFEGAVICFGLADDALDNAWIQCDQIVQLATDMQDLWYEISPPNP